MNKEQILAYIRQQKPRYEEEGFQLHGLFGSVARGEETEASDVDILYRLTPEFARQHPGFSAMARVEEIGRELSYGLERPVEFAPVDYLGKTGEKYILGDVVLV